MKNKIFTVLFAIICLPALANDTNFTNYEMDDTPEYVDDTGIDWHKFSSGYFELDESSRGHAAGLNPGDWRAFYRDETEVLGTATCNQYTEPGLFTAAEKRGPNCWCKIIATTKDIHKNAPSKWILRGEYENAAECAHMCTYRCSYNFLDDPDFRGEIFNK